MKHTLVKWLSAMLIACMLVTAGPAAMMEEEVVVSEVETPSEEVVISLGDDEPTMEGESAYSQDMDSVSTDEEAILELDETEQEIASEEVFQEENIEDELIEDEVIYSKSSNPQVLFFWNETVTYTVSQGFNFKNEPYASGANVGTASKGSNLTFIRLIVNGYSNLWGMTSDNKYAYLGLKVKNGSWSTDGTQYFKNVKKPIGSQIQFSNIAYPSNYTISSTGYYLSSGSVTSIYPLKTIKTEISSNSGKIISTYTRSVSGTVYAVKNLDTLSTSDNGVKFSWIKDPGTYYWKLTATDQAGYSKTYTMQFSAIKGTPAPAVEILPTSVELTSKNINLKVGETYRLYAAVYPGNATNLTVKWSTDNLNVATVSNGLITAKGVGTAKIIAMTVNNKIDTATVTVSAGIVYPTSINLNINNINIYEGGRMQLNPTVYPSNSTNKSVSYKSSKTSVARVDNNGIVTAVKKGSCKVTATTSNGKSASVTITVLEVPKPSKVTINYSGTVELKLNNQLKLIAQILPSGAKSTLTWKSSSTKIATVSSSGVVTPKKAGKVTITVKTENGKKASVKVVVVDPEIATKVYFDAAAILANKLAHISKDVTLNVGEKEYFPAFCVPSTAHVVEYWSSDKKVATVDSMGNVTALKKGSAKIYAKSKNGKKASFKLKVK